MAAKRSRQPVVHSSSPHAPAATPAQERLVWEDPTRVDVATQKISNAVQKTNFFGIGVNFPNLLDRRLCVLAQHQPSSKSIQIRYRLSIKPKIQTSPKKKIPGVKTNAELRFGSLEQERETQAMKRIMYLHAPPLPL